MQISHDYVTRFLGTSIQAPRNKPDVTDEIFLTVINSAGGHQRMIDCSRCTNVQSFHCLGSCKSLLYLDVSFTSISSLQDISDNCLVLKALNLAHTHILDFSPIQQLETLEVFNVRHSNFPTCDLLRNLLVLRSLDLGETAIDSISQLTHLYRLEELLLDGCKNLLKSSSDAAMPSDDHAMIESDTERNLRESLLRFDGLRLLNIADVGVSENWMDKFLAECHEDICIEGKSRREQIVDAILANDPVRTRTLLQCGVSVDLVAEEWAEKLLSTTWRTKCKFGSQLAPYFIVNHPDPLLRPRIVHIAIYFNRQKALKPLIEMNVDMTCRVWMSEVKDTKGRIVINEKKVKRPEACVIKTPYLPMECSDRGVYNFTEGMIQSSETKWRALSAAIQEQIEQLFLGLWFRDEITRPQSRAVQEATNDAIAFPADDIVSLAAAKLALESDTSTIQSASVQEIVDNEGSVQQSENNEDMAAINQPDESGKVARAPKKRAQKSTIAPKPDRPDWKTHAMVAKLLGPPQIMKSSISRRDVQVLGKRSYWLESRQWAARKFAEKERQLLEQNLEFRREEQRLLDARNRTVSLVPPSEEDSLVPAHRSKYDLPIDPSVQQFGLPGRGLQKSIGERRKEMRELLNKKLHVDIDY